MAITRIGPNNSTNISGINLTSQVTGTLPTGNGGTGATSFSPGKILQVVTSENVYATSTTSASFTDILSSSGTTWETAITPSATSSKILVLISQSNKVERGSATSLEYDLRLFRDSTEVEKWTNVCAEDVTNDAKFYGSNHAYHFQDSPSSTSSITFKTTGQIVSSGGGRTVAFQNSSAPSTMTLMEIAG